MTILFYLWILFTNLFVLVGNLKLEGLNITEYILAKFLIKGLCSFAVLYSCYKLTIILLQI